MITIVGGGPGGLMLAKILSDRAIPCQVMEADESDRSRHQGGMLDIHEDSGQLALKAAGLIEPFWTHVMKDGDDFRLMNSDGKLAFEAPGNGRRPEIERGPLRQMLLDSLPDGVVRWGRGVAAVSESEGGFELTLKDGSRELAEVVVGADGAWSKVRPLVTDAQPAYTGVTFVEMHYHDAVRRNLKANEMMGNGTLMALGEDRAFLGHREPNDRLTFYAALRVPEDWGTRSIVDRETLHAAFHNWDQAFHVAIDESDSLEVRRLYALPVGLTWHPRQHVTLVGDAAHLMSPFAGEGVNQALTDGHELAQAMLSHPADLPEAIRAYEAEMFTRTSALALESAENLDRFMSPHGLENALTFFKSIEGSDDASGARCDGPR